MLTWRNGQTRGTKNPVRKGAGSSPVVSTNALKTGEIYKISPVLLSLGNDWEVFLPRFQSKIGVFVCNLQFVFNFVNFLQHVFARIVSIASVNL